MHRETAAAAAPESRHLPSPQPMNAAEAMPSPRNAPTRREDDGVYRRLIEGIHDYAIYMLDLEGRVSSWNPGAERFKGYRAEEVEGRHFSMFYTPEDREQGRPARALRIAREEGRFEDTAWRLRKDGRQFWAHVVIDLIRDEQGAPAGFAKITRDITERRDADLRLRELTHSHRELEQFIHIASHDLREPLRKVLSFCDLLLEEEGAALSVQGRGYVGSAMDATRRMQALLASLLSLTRVTSEGAGFNPCDLGEVLREVLADLELPIQERAAQVELGPLPALEADAAQMRQLFQNLVENAVKYAHDERPPRIRIAERPASEPGWIAVECRDNGIGFEPEYAERIFGVFQRLHGRERYGGAGIGLSICRKICQRHGGRIEAEGRPGEGAAFTIHLPRRHHPDDC